jgi:hypothetical protein
MFSLYANGEANIRRGNSPIFPGNPLLCSALVETALSAVQVKDKQNA